VSKKDAPRGKQRPWLPTCRQELYTYFGIVIHIGITIELVVEDYWGPIKRGATYKVGDYILKNCFKQLERYIRCSSIPKDGFYSTFNRVDKLSKYL
jgi:hypothetical protein